MTNNYRLHSMTLDLARSIEFDKETFLSEMQEASGLPLEVFLYLFVMEEYPVTISRRESIVDFKNDDVIFEISQQFRIRRRTPEELLMLDETTHETKSKDLNLR